VQDFHPRLYGFETLNSLLQLYTASVVAIVILTTTVFIVEIFIKTVLIELKDSFKINTPVNETITEKMSKSFNYQCCIIKSAEKVDSEIMSEIPYLFIEKPFLNYFEILTDKKIPTIIEKVHSEKELFVSYFSKQGNLAPIIQKLKNIGCEGEDEVALFMGTNLISFLSYVFQEETNDVVFVVPVS